MLRHDWTTSEVQTLFALPFNDLLFKAQTIHWEHFDPNKIQLSTLLSIKTGACPEDCQYCPQSVHYDTGVDAHPLLSREEICEAARRAKEAGANSIFSGDRLLTTPNPEVDEDREYLQGLGIDTYESAAEVRSERDALSR